jgi:RNA polymerase sigma-70 factor (ECF subfamily)
VTSQPKLRLVEPPPDEEIAHDLDSLFRRYARYVGSIALRILGREDEVEDLVQEVFLDAHGGLGELRDPGAVRGWLAKVTVRKARRVLSRRRLKRLVGLDAAPDYGQVADDAASPEQRVLLAEIYRLLDDLPADERLAWSLRYVEGESLQSVAELCGCSLATAKRRVAAARTKIGGELRR